MQKIVRNIKWFLYELNRKISELFKGKTEKKIGLSKMKSRQTIFIVLALAIPVLHFMVFWVYVNFNSLLLAFQNVEGGQTIFTLANFKEVFTSLTSPTGALLNALKNTMIFFVYGVLVFPLGIFWAYFLFKGIKLKSFFRVMFYVPAIVSAVVMANMFKYAINPDGPIGILFQNLTGMDRCPSFLTEKEYAIWTVLIYSFWTGFAGSLLLIGGAMARINPEIFESANLDGIGMLREFWNICIPLIWPTLSTVLITFVAGIFSASGEILLLTNGAGDTTTISFWLFYQVKYYNSYYVPSAFGLVLTAIALPITLIVRHFLNKIYADVEF